MSINITNNIVSPLLQKYYSLEAIGNLRKTLILLLKFELFTLIKAKEPWNNSAVLYLPLEKQYILYGPSSLASFLFLKSLNLSFDVKFVKNSNEMSPSGMP